MKKKYMAFILCITLAATLGLCACADKEVDYDTLSETDNETGTTGKSVLATKLGIPDSYEGEISVGNSGLSSIKIEADEITAPSGDSMSYLTCIKNEFDSDYKKQICEAVFDKDDGIYVYDEEHQLASDVQIQLDYYNERLAYAESVNDTEFEEIFQEEIDELEDLLENSVSELTPVSDYSADNFLGFINGEKFLLEFNDEQNDEYGNVWSEFYLSYYPTENLISYKPYEGAFSVSIGGEFGYGTDIEADNVCEYTLSDAEAYALKFLGNIGIENVGVVETGLLGWQYTDALYNELYYEEDGYAFKYSRLISGEVAPVVYISKEESEYSGTGMSNSVKVVSSYNEGYDVEVDSNGVIYMSADFVLTEENEETNVDIISWDEALKILNDSAGEYFAENKPDYTDVVFNDVRLMYLLIKDPANDDTYNYTPVWYFGDNNPNDYSDVESINGVEAGLLDYEYLELYPETVIIINAMDGTVYDLDDIFVS